MKNMTWSLPTLKSQKDGETPLVDTEDAIACTGQDKEGEDHLSSIESASAHRYSRHLCAWPLVR